jgi:hypothetical protein
LDQRFYSATPTKTKGIKMMWDPITCHGQSWGNYCLVCEQEEFDKFMHNNVEANWTDEVDDYDN